jgi:hypothetical protein
MTTPNLRFLALALVLAAGCSKNAPEPEKDAGAAAVASASSSATHPFQPPPAVDGAVAPALPSREPDWGLNSDDPAADYVGRYVRAVQRYGVQTACVVVGKSTLKDGLSAVEVRNGPTGCGTANELRDTFLVNPAADRLHLAEPDKHDPLRKWPDMSDPEAPAGPPQEVQDILHWKSPLKEALKGLQLVPIRVQWYGRGTYPIVTIADWHATVTRDASPASLSAAAQKLCAATNGQPLAIFGGLDRVNLLRVVCPDKTRWERF